MTQIKTANDLISDSVDAFFAGDMNMADQYLDEALGQKMTERMVGVLKDMPEFQPQQS